MKQLSLIILTYNSEKDIYNCLESVSKYNDIGDALEIIVVDNNSTNYIDMHDKIKSLYPDVRIIANTKNGGYGQGNNVGIRAASAPIVSIMNPDVRLIMPVFQTFIDVLSKDENIMCGGKQYATMTKQNPSFYYDFTESGIRQSIGRIICHKLDIYNQKRMWLQGAFFAIKKDIFEQIGLFDETLFMYAEEFDIHLRIKKYLSTYNIIYLPQLKYLHLTSNRGFSAECIKKQYNADIYVCKKHGLSIRKMLQNIHQAHTIGCIISSLITKKTNRNINNQIVQKKILNDLMEKYKYPNPMKIAYISPTYFSDVDLSYLSHAQSSIDITYFVPIFNHNLKGAAFNLSSCFDKYGIFMGTDIYPQLNNFKKIIDTTKFYVINSPAKRMWYPKNIWLYIKLMWKLRQYDVIHITEFPRYHEWFYYFLRKKIVLTVHDPIPHSTAICNTKQVLLNRKLGLTFFKNFIILNKTQQDDFIRTNKLQKKNIYNSQLGRYDYLKMYQTEHNDTKKYILFFGQIASNKGLDILFPAMKELHKTHPNIRLIVAGKGQFSFDITPYKDLEYIDIRNYFIPDNELAQLIHNALFVVCPYKDATQSGVVMSAFAFNKPVIATNVGGFPEQVIHNQFGLIVAPNNIQALTNAMSELCENHNKLLHLQENIRMSYEQNGINSWEKIVSEMMHIYTAMSYSK